ncbi:MAG: carboxymuconolactone decarboxylase family protein [Mycobacterium sp.]
MISSLARLIALSPDGSLGQINALVRQTCASVLRLPALGSPDEPCSAPAVVEFAEQFSVDVTGISDTQRERLLSALGGEAFGAVVLTYIADFAPRVLAGLDAVGLPAALPSLEWDRTTDPADAVFNGFLPAVARATALDSVTSEIVRLRGAGQHHCRLCNSLREATALEAGGSEDLYGDISLYEASSRLTDAHKAALRYVDALIWSPGNIAPSVSAGIRTHFGDAEAVEITFDVMRNAANKIAVAMAADAPRVEQGTQRYRIMANGCTEYE